MQCSKMKLWLLAFTLVIASILGTFSLPQAETITQSEYVVLLAEKLGLGEDLTAEEAAIMLEGVGVAPTGGWRLDHDVTCELVAEVQVLAIKSAQMGVIRRAPEGIHPLVAALSDELHICPPPTVEIYPMVSTPPPPIATEVKGAGVSTGGGGTSSPSE